MLWTSRNDDIKILQLSRITSRPPPQAQERETNSASLNEHPQSSIDEKYLEWLHSEDLKGQVKHEV